MPKISPLPEQTLVTLRQLAEMHSLSAEVELHLLERIEALEADCVEESQVRRTCDEAIVRRLEKLEATDRLDAEAWASMRRASSDYQRRLVNLEAAQQQPAGHAPGATGAASTPESAPVATDAELVRCYAKAVENALKAGDGIESAAAAGLFAIYNLGCQHGAAQPSAAPSVLDARAWSYIGKMAMCGDLEALALIDQLDQSTDAQPTTPAMQRLIDAPSDARGYVDLRDPPAAQPPAQPPADRKSMGCQEYLDSISVYAPKPPAAQPTPEPAPPAAPAAPAGGLVESVLRELPAGIDPRYVRHAIRAVARWIRSEPIGRSVADRLEQEADR